VAVLRKSGEDALFLRRLGLVIEPDLLEAFLCYCGRFTSRERAVLL